MSELSEMIRNNQVEYKRESVRLRLADKVEAIEKKVKELEYYVTNRIESIKEQFDDPEVLSNSYMEGKLAVLEDILLQIQVTVEAG